MIHEEKERAACVLRLFGAQDAAVQRAVQQLPGTTAQCRSRGAETLLALRADSPQALERAQKTLRHRFPAELYGEGETTLAAAVVQALEHRRRLLVCSNAAAGALLETRLETVPAAEKVFDFGAMSYADEAVRAKLDTRIRRVKGGAAAVELARVHAARQLVGTEFAVGCLERAEDTVLLVGSRKGCWVRTVNNGDAPALWLLDMLRRAVLGLGQTAGTCWQKYGKSIPPEALTPHSLPGTEAPGCRRPSRHRLRKAAVAAVVLALAVLAAGWYYTGGDLAALPQKLQSLGADSLPHAGAKLI